MTDQPLVGGRYRLRARTSRAADPERWEATDVVLVRPVMVEWADAGSEPAFAQAVATSARLAHPGIVAVYDTGTEDGRPYVVTELPAGTTLRATLHAHGPLSANRVTGLGLRLAAALGAAHRGGVVHGHLSLDDVVLDDYDHTKMAGLGAAPPGASAAADVAAAGALLYELLCGRAPAPGGPAPRQVRPGVPAALDRVINAALNGSISTADALHEGLAQVDVSADDAAPAIVRDPTPPVGVRPVALGRPVRHRSQLAGVVALAMVAAALAAVAAVLVATNAGRARPGPGPTIGGNRVAAIVITDVRSFDPLGDHHENDARLALVHDGNPNTVWSSETYLTRHFGNLKSGVGLYLTLDRSRSLSDLIVSTPLAGWSAEVYVAAQPATALPGWGAPVAHFTVADRVATVALGQAAGRAVLVWITDLGPTDRVDIGELSLT